MRRYMFSSEENEYRNKNKYIQTLPGRHSSPLQLVQHCHSPSPRQIQPRRSRQLTRTLPMMLWVCKRLVLRVRA